MSAPENDRRTALGGNTPPTSSADGETVTLSPSELDKLSRHSNPDSPALPADEVLAGRYRIIHVLGRGGMGEVYEAEDVELRARVALKIIRPELAAHAEV